MTTAAEAFSDFSLSCRLRDIPEAVGEAAKLHLLDTIGCGLAAHACGEGTYARCVAKELGGVAEATAIGIATRLPAPSAALANATLCHALDYDDTHSFAGCHVSVVVVPAALAVAEGVGATGEELLIALVTANETVTRIGLAAPRAFHRRGFHPTSVCGVFGATVAAARMHELSPRETASALGLAGSFASGLFAYLDAGTPTKPIHPGIAAQQGILAARLARRGATGPTSVFESRFGFMFAYAGTYEHQLRSQVDDLGERWETLQIGYKAFPACNAMHGCLGAAQALHARGLDAHAVTEVVVRVAPLDVPMVLEPLAEKLRPRSSYEAKFSLPYSVAAMLAYGEVNLETYSGRALTDPLTLGLAEKVRYETRDFPTHPADSPGAVQVAFRDGTSVEAVFEHAPGSPGHPLAPSAIRAKFAANAGLAIENADARQIQKAVLELESATTVSELVEPLRTLEPRH